MKRLPSGPLRTIEKLVLVPSIDLEQPKAMRRSATRFIFCHFGQKLIFAHSLEFSVWGGFHVYVDLQTYHNTICKVFLDHWDHKEWVWGLGVPDCKIWLMYIWLVHHGKSTTWTKVKWNWLVHFVSILGHFLFSMNLIGCKKIRSKWFVVFKWQCVKVVVMTWF